jgi:hypothetical protein
MMRRHENSNEMFYSGFLRQAKKEKLYLNTLNKAANKG